MRIVRLLAVPSLLLIWLLAGALPVYPQADSTIYVVVDYKKSEPGQEGDYVAMERDLWKAIHAERIKADETLGWYLYSVAYPGGSGGEYNFVTLHLYDDIQDVQNAYADLEQLVARAHSGMDMAELFGHPGAGYTVRSELWQLIDATTEETPQTTPSRFMAVDYMRTKPGQGAAYLSVEQDLWKPVHQERVRTGRLDAWRLSVLLSPYGTTYPYDFATANFFDDLSQYVNGYPDDLFSQVHPSMDPDEIGTRTNDSRDLVRGELWQLVEYVDQESLDQAGQ